MNNRFILSQTEINDYRYHMEPINTLYFMYAHTYVLNSGILRCLCIG